METLYRVDFIKVNDSGEPVPGTGWSWSGTEHGVGNAISTAMNAMIDALDECGRYRVFRVENVHLARALGESRG